MAGNGRGGGGEVAEIAVVVAAARQTWTIGLTR